MQPIAFRTVPTPPAYAPAGRAQDATRPQSKSPGTPPAVTLPATASAIAVSVTASSPVAVVPDRHSPTVSAGFSASDLDALQSVGRGRAENSPAAQARAAIAENPDLANIPFGRVVSQIARDESPVLPSSAEPSPIDMTAPPPDISTDSGSAGTDGTADGVPGTPSGGGLMVTSDVGPEADLSAPDDGPTSDSAVVEASANVDFASNPTPALDDDPDLLNAVLS
jgi:hypothetical protein